MDAPISGVLLRVKRHRESVAPTEIVLEATSRAAAAAADLCSGLHASLRLDGQAAQPDSSMAPPTKRCRFVLLSTSDKDAAAAAAAAQSEDSHMLELWNLRHLQKQAEGAPVPAPPPQQQQEQQQQQQQQQEPPQPPASPVRHPAEVYEEMVQQYLQQQQQQQQQQQHHHHHHHQLQRRPPHRCTLAARQPPQHQVGQGPSQVQQAKRLPEYATRAMLQAYGLQACAQEMDVAAGLFADDVYLLHETDAAAAAGQDSGDGCGVTRPVVQVWEDELPELQHVWDAQAGDGGSDSEDSNAEGHYANSYPDDDEGAGHSDDDDDNCDDDDVACGGSDSSSGHGARGCCVDMGGGISSYQAARSTTRQRRHGVVEEACCSDGDDAEFDVDEYVSSGDEEVAGLHGGAAWRAVLAAQLVPPPSPGGDVPM